MYNSTNKICETAKKSDDFTKMALTGACSRFLQPDCSRPADTGSQISGRVWKRNCGGDPKQGTDRNWKRLYSRECPKNTSAGTDEWPVCIKGGKEA